MANPNIVNVSSIYGKLLTGSAPTLTPPTEISDTVYKINAIYVANSTTSAAEANVTIGSIPLVSVSVPGKSTLDVLSKPIYLTDNALPGLVCTAAAGLDYIVSYEEISDQ